MKHPRLQGWFLGWGADILSLALTLTSVFLLSRSVASHVLPFLFNLSLFVIGIPFSLFYYWQAPDVLRDIVGLMTHLSIQTVLLGIGFLCLWLVVAILFSFFLDKQLRQRPSYNPSSKKHLLLGTVCFMPATVCLFSFAWFFFLVRVFPGVY